MVALALAALAAFGGGPAPAVVVFDLAPFYVDSLTGALPGTCAVEGTVVAARIDVAFVSYEGSDWHLEGTFVLPTGSAGFSSATEGWTGPGWFHFALETDAFDGALVHANNTPYFEWSFEWTCGSPIVLPNGHVVYVPIDGGFTDLRLTLTVEPFVPCKPATWTDLGCALPADASAPTLAGAGDLCDGDLALVVSGAECSGTALVVLGASAANWPLFGGTLVPTPDLVFSTALDAYGACDIPLPFARGLPPGFSIWTQVWVVDPDEPKGFAATNALRLDLP